MKTTPLFPTQISVGGGPWVDAHRDDYDELATRFGSVNLSAAITKLETFQHEKVELGTDHDGDLVAIRPAPGLQKTKGFFRRA